MSKTTTIGVVLGVVGAAAATATPINSQAYPRATDIGAGPGFAAAVDRDGPIVYSAPPITADGFFSDGAAGQFYGQMIADNFTLTNDTTVSGVNWWGSSENYFLSDYTNFDAFSVMVLDGNFDVVYAENFSTADTNPVATGMTNTSGGLQFFQSVKFAQSFDLLGGTEYWLAIGSINGSPDGDAWIWSTAAGDGLIAADQFDGSGFVVFPDQSDTAFEIQGVPTPGAASLFAVAGLVMARRRR